MLSYINLGYFIVCVGLGGVLKRRGDRKKARLREELGLYCASVFSKMTRRNGQHPSSLGISSTHQSVWKCAKEGSLGGRVDASCECIGDEYGE